MTAVRSRAAILAIVVAVCLTRPAPVAAQENFEIQVYGSETVAPGHTMIELHSNVTARGTTRTENGVRPTEGAWHETIEITHGFTPWFEVGLYLFTSVQPDTGVGVGRGSPAPARARARELALARRREPVRRVRLPGAPVLDGYLDPRAPVHGRRLGRWYWSLNPTLGWSFEGESEGKGAEFSPNFKVSYDVTPKVDLGLEYYASLGPLSGFDPPGEALPGV